MGFAERLKNDINGLTQIFFRRRDLSATKLYLYIPALSQFMLENEFPVEEETQDRNLYFHKDFSKDMMMAEVNTSSGTIMNKPFSLLLRKINTEHLYGLARRKFTGTSDVPEISPIMHADQHYGIEYHFISPFDGSIFADFMINNRKAVSNMLDLITLYTNSEKEPGWGHIEHLRNIYRAPRVPAERLDRSVDLEEEFGKETLAVSNLAVCGRGQVLDTIAEVYPTVILLQRLVKYFKAYQTKWLETNGETGLIDQLSESILLPTTYDIPIYPGEAGINLIQYSQTLADRGLDANREKEITGRLLRNLPAFVDYDHLGNSTGPMHDETLGNEANSILIKHAWYHPTRYQDPEDIQRTTRAELSRIDTILDESFFETGDGKLFDAGVKAYMELGGRLYWNPVLDKQLNNDLEIVGAPEAPTPKISIFLVTDGPLEVTEETFGTLPYTDLIRKNPKLVHSTTEDDTPFVYAIDRDSFFQTYVNPATGELDQEVAGVQRVVNQLLDAKLENEFEKAAEQSTAFKEYIFTPEAGAEDQEHLWASVYRYANSYLGETPPNPSPSTLPQYNRVLNDYVALIEEEAKSVAEAGFLKEENLEGLVPDRIGDEYNQLAEFMFLKHEEKKHRFLTMVAVTGIFATDRTTSKPISKIEQKGVDGGITEIQPNNFTIDERSTYTTVDKFLGGRTRQRPLGAASSRADARALFELPKGLRSDILDSLQFRIEDSTDDTDEQYIAFQFPLMNPEGEFLPLAPVWNFIRKSEMNITGEDVSNILEDDSMEVEQKILAETVERILKFALFQVLIRIRLLNRRITYLNTVKDFYAGNAAAQNVGFTPSPVRAAAEMKGEFQGDFPSLAGLYPIVNDEINLLNYVSDHVSTLELPEDLGEYNQASQEFARFVRVPLFGKAFVGMGSTNLLSYKLRYKGNRSTKVLPGTYPVLFNEFAALPVEKEGEPPITPDEQYQPVNEWPGKILPADWEGVAEADQKWKPAYDLLNNNYKVVQAVAKQDVNVFQKTVEEDFNELTDQQLKDALEPFKVTARLKMEKLYNALGKKEGLEVGVAVGVIPFVKAPDDS